MSVGVGQQLLITDPASFCLQFAASAASEAYLIGVQSVSEVASGLTDVQLVAAKDPAVPAPPPAPPARLTTQGFTRDLVITDRMRRWSAHRETHASFQRRQLESLSHLDVGLPMASGPTTIPTTVVVGDMLAINVPDYNGDVCLNPIAITAEVKHIGAKGVWLEDVANPAGGFSAADYQSLSDQPRQSDLRYRCGRVRRSHGLGRQWKDRHPRDSGGQQGIGVATRFRVQWRSVTHRKLRGE